MAEIDKRYQDALIGMTRRHLKKYKRNRKLKSPTSKPGVAGGVAVAFASNSQDGPT